MFFSSSEVCPKQHLLLCTKKAASQTNTYLNEEQVVIAQAEHKRKNSDGRHTFFSLSLSLSLYLHCLEAVFWRMCARRCYNRGGHCEPSTENGVGVEHISSRGFRLLSTPFRVRVSRWYERLMLKCSTEAAAGLISRRRK